MMGASICLQTVPQYLSWNTKGDRVHEHVVTAIAVPPDLVWVRRREKERERKRRVLLFTVVVPPALPQRV